MALVFQISASAMDMLETLARQMFDLWWIAGSLENGKTKLLIAYQWLNSIVNVIASFHQVVFIDVAHYSGYYFHQIGIGVTG